MRIRTDSHNIKPSNILEQTEQQRAAKSGAVCDELDVQRLAEAIGRLPEADRRRLIQLLGGADADG